MTVVLLDGEPLTGLGEPGRVADVVHAVRNRLAARDRLVVGIGCDGVTIPEPELSQTLDRAVNGIERLELRSERLSSLVLGALRQAAGLLTELQISREAIANALAEARAAEAMKSLGEFMRTWSQTLSAVERCAEAMQISLDDLSIAGRSVTEHVGDVALALRSLKDGLTAQDFVIVADQMRYEMPATIDAWHAVLRAMIEHVESRAMTAAGPLPADGS